MCASFFSHLPQDDAAEVNFSSKYCPRMPQRGWCGGFLREEWASPHGDCKLIQDILGLCEGRCVYDGAFVFVAPNPNPCPLACGLWSGGGLLEGNCRTTQPYAADFNISARAVNSTGFLQKKGHKKDIEDPKGTGQRYSKLNLEQPKNCKTEDPDGAKREKKRRSVPKKRYSHSHFLYTYSLVLRSFNLCSIFEKIVWMRKPGQMKAVIVNSISIYQ